MNKIGKYRKPEYVFILTLATFSLLTLFGICAYLEELRKFRKKGINGLIVFFVISATIGLMTLFLNTDPKHAGIVFVCMLLFVLLPSFIYISVVSGNEIKGSEATKKEWDSISLLPIAGIILMLIVPSISIYPTSTWLEANDEGIATLLSIIMFALWVYVIQRRLNLLWKQGVTLQPFAIPEMEDSESSDTIDSDKDESNAQNR